MTWTNFYKLLKKLQVLKKFEKLQSLFLICVTIRTYLLSVYLSSAYDYLNKNTYRPGHIFDLD